MKQMFIYDTEEFNIYSCSQTATARLAQNRPSSSSKSSLTNDVETRQRYFLFFQRRNMCVTGVILSVDWGPDAKVQTECVAVDGWKRAISWPKKKTWKTPTDRMNAMPSQWWNRIWKLKIGKETEREFCLHIKWNGKVSSVLTVAGLTWTCRVHIPPTSQLQ